MLRIHAQHRPPVPSAEHLFRPRLTERLLHSEARLSLLQAPAGSGKSQLLRECAQVAPDGVMLCWLDLDGAADAFELRLARALGLPDPQLLESALQGSDRPLWIMLDQYPGQASPNLDQTLMRLLQLSTPQVRWWIATRRRPGWPIPRWLLSGDACLVDASQLALTREEAGALRGLLEQPGDALTLLHRTQGWLAGARLYLMAAPTAEGSGDYQQLLADYLQCDLLAGIPGAARKALTLLACLPSIDATLYDSVLELVNDAPCLTELLAMGVFLEPLPRSPGRYRINPAVADNLATMACGRHRIWLCLRACQYFAAIGDTRQAIELALRAEQVDVAASLMQRMSLDQLLYGAGPGQLLSWYEQLPEELHPGSPQLVLLQSWALALAGRLEEASRCAEQLAAFLPRPRPAEQRQWLASWQLLSARIALSEGLPDVAAAAIAEVSPVMSQLHWSEQVLAQLMQGEWEAPGYESEICAQSLKRVREHRCVALEGLLVLQQAEQLDRRGELERAQGLAARVLAEAGECSALLRGRACLHLGRSAWRAGRLDESEGFYRQALHACSEAGDPALAWAHAGLAEVAVARSQVATGFEEVGEALRDLQRLKVSQILYRPLLDLVRGKLWLLQGKHERSAELADFMLEQCHCRPSWRIAYIGLCVREAFELLRSRAQLSLHKDCSQRLELHLQHITRCGYLGQAGELWFALAEIHMAFGRQRKAQAALFEGVALAQRLGSAGTECHWLSSCSEINKWVARLDLDKEEAIDTAAILLSRRERSVLAMIAEGRANQEIADSLHISLHTVKSHAQRINTKLGVSRRTQAIVRAKSLGLVN